MSSSPIQEFKEMEISEPADSPPPKTEPQYNNTFFDVDKLKRGEYKKSHPEEHKILNEFYNNASPWRGVDWQYLFKKS